MTYRIVTNGFYFKIQECNKASGNAVWSDYRAVASTENYFKSLMDAQEALEHINALNDELQKKYGGEWTPV